MPPRSAIRRRYIIYHPIVTKLLVAMAALGLLMLIASNEEGKQALNGIHIAASISRAVSGGVLMRREALRP